MATYISNVFATKPSAESAIGGTRFVTGRVEVPNGTAHAASDVLKLFQLRANESILGFHFQCNDWATTATAGTLGTSTLDDDTAIDLDLVIADVDLDVAGVKLAFATPLQAIAVGSTEDAICKVVIGTVTDGLSNLTRYINFSAIIGCWPSSAPGYAYTWNGEASGAGVLST